MPSVARTSRRQAAIEALKGLPTWWADEGVYYGGAQPPMVALLDPEDAVSAIENLPSVQPETLTDPEPLTDKEQRIFLAAMGREGDRMSRYINLDEATDLLRGIDATMAGEFVADLLESLPTIEIVRCSECKYREKCEQIVAFEIGENQIEGRKIDFCSYGERIDNE